MAEYYSSMLCYKIIISYQNMSCIARLEENKASILLEKKKNTSNLILLVHYFKY